MTKAGNSQIMRTIPLLITIFSLSLPAYAQYSGGTGEHDDPYQIATAEDLILLGDSPEDYEKHFILTADIDMDPNLPGRKVFDKAVIAADLDGESSGFQGVSFRGQLDGLGHVIRGLYLSTTTGYAGLFGRIESGGCVSDVNLAHGLVRTHAWRDNQGAAGGLAGENRGTIQDCRCDMAVQGFYNAGGLVGSNFCSILDSFSTSTVTGDDRVGGLVGRNSGSISDSFSTSKVTGDDYVGGLVGDNRSSISNCYSAGTVTGDDCVGGLVGFNENNISICYSTTEINGNSNVGGLIGWNGAFGHVSNSFWDIETSGLLNSDGGIGLTTVEMMDSEMLALNGLANDPNWVLDPGRDYPRLAWQDTTGAIIDRPAINWLDGDGTHESPYQITNPAQLVRLSKAGALSDKHFALINDIDLEGLSWFHAVFPLFEGAFDGNGHIIANLRIRGSGHLGLFGESTYEATISNLGLEVVDVNGTGYYIGSLVGENGGYISNSYCTSMVKGNICVGSFVGYNHGRISNSYGTGTVTGDYSVGGLTGYNLGRVINSYSTCKVTGNHYVGGLVGTDYFFAHVSNSFWDIETSGLLNSDGGIGLTTVEMMDSEMLALNGLANDPNWVLDPGRDYPRLAWQNTTGAIIGQPAIDWLDGDGTHESPYRIASPDQLVRLAKAGALSDKHFVLTNDIDLEGLSWSQAVFPLFDGTFDGNGHVIANLRIRGNSYLGLFGKLNSEAMISSIRMKVVDVNGTGSYIGGLVGVNEGCISNSCSTGKVTGDYGIGGLVGFNTSQEGSVSNSYSTGTVTGHRIVGGLVGENSGRISDCCSTGRVTGDAQGGGLVGLNNGTVSRCFWDMENSGLSESDGGKGLTTAEMQDAEIFLNAGWDFTGEIINGTCDFWKSSEHGYPRLSYPVMGLGLGTAETPYLIHNALDLGTVWFKPKAHYRLEESLNLAGITWSSAVVHWFGGTFDGKGHVISNLHIQGTDNLGLFGEASCDAVISSLGLKAVDVNGTGDYVGALVGQNKSGSISFSCSNGTIKGTYYVGGLVGWNGGSISNSYSDCSVDGTHHIGGIVGWNSYTKNLFFNISNTYSTGAVIGRSLVGGLVGTSFDFVPSSFWDIESSGLDTSAGGTGLTTDEMQTAFTFLDAGWDFVDETANGTEDIWWILEGQDYPRLWWEDSN